ncbi:NAD(P)H-hydrate epimerase [Candidatus Woesearchaeota archaeon]|nr:NAD(P)H-hydrate epimerase [Candidatus Woesearchaeota archaeon]
MALTAMTCEQLRNLDVTAATAGFPEELLAERSGLELARFLEERVRREETLLFMCGPGNNGGDGLSAARHLANKGYGVSVLLSGAARSAVTARGLKMLDVLRVPVHVWEEGFSFTPYDVVVDCLLGCGQDGEPRGAVRSIVLGVQGKRSFACDLPTGVHCDTGEVYDAHVQAEATLSLAAPKKAFLEEGARRACGDITVVGIGIPAVIYEQVGVRACLVEGQARFP